MASPDSVSFVGIQKNYPPGEMLEVSYSLQEGLTSASRDWVGLFRVGWSSSRDYYTFEWAPQPTEKKGTVVFAGKRLPPEDKHFYQFCFVSSDGRVRGASSPFQFTITATGEHVEDLELVEISEDSLMILQPKEVLEIEVKNEAGKTDLEEELVSVRESFTKLEVEKEILATKYEEDCATKSEECEKMEAQIVELERQLQAKRDSESRLMEKLEKERAIVHELTAAKSTEESQVKVLREQKVEVEVALAAQQELVGERAQRVVELESFVQELEQRNKVLCRQLEQGTAQLNQLREVQVELMSQIGEKNKEIDQTVLKLAEMEERCAEQEKKFREERDQLLQEVAVAQQNIAELLGARRDGVEVAALAGNQEPPTLPVTHMAMVDRSAYEALQQAYDNIEQMYHDCFEENRDLRSRVHDKKNVHGGCQRKVAELTHRIEQCRIEYEAKCKESHEVQKQSQLGGGFAEKVAILQNKLVEMEDNQEQVTKSLDSALQELASRREELKQKDMALAHAGDEVQGLGDALRHAKEEYSQFQDKHDQVVNEKRAKLDEHEATIRAQVSEIAELGKERGKLNHTVEQLRDQLQTLKQQAKSTDKACPVCSTKFPGRISQKDFEKHVQGHFN